jgi:hypothetical protein
MTVQGILRACYQKAGFFSTHMSNIKERQRLKNTSVPIDEYLLFSETVYSDFSALMEQVMGSLKAIEPNKDLPFDTMAFTQRNSSNDEKQ